VTVIVVIDLPSLFTLFGAALIPADVAGGVTNPICGVVDKVIPSVESVAVRVMFSGARSVKVKTPCIVDGGHAAGRTDLDLAPEFAVRDTVLPLTGLLFASSSLTVT